MEVGRDGGGQNLVSLWEVVPSRRLHRDQPHGGEPGAAGADRQLVVDQFAPAVGEDRQAVGKPCSVAIVRPRGVDVGAATGLRNLVFGEIKRNLSQNGRVEFKRPEEALAMLTEIAKFLLDHAPEVVDVVKEYGPNLVPLPTTEGFALAIVNFDGDDGNRIKDLVVDEILEFAVPNLKVLRFEKPIRVVRAHWFRWRAGSNPQEEIAAAHERARSYLAKSGATVLLWGQIFELAGKRAARFFWTTPQESFRSRELTSLEDFATPESFSRQSATVITTALFRTLADYLSPTGVQAPSSLPSWVSCAQGLIDSEFARHWVEPEQRNVLRIALADLLSRLGDQYLRIDFLEQAVRNCRELSAATSHDHNVWLLPYGRLTLGGALGSLGELTGNTELLEQAVTACRQATSSFGREREPEHWARAQHNLGIALGRLGEGIKQAARLEEAVQAFKSALEVRSHDRCPIDWAMTEQKLGTSYLALGALSNDDAALMSAVAAFGEALKVLSADVSPMEWARTNGNLGVALLSLGLQPGNQGNLSQAVGAFRSALRVWNRENTPLEWARNLQNLGIALEHLDACSPSLMNLSEAAQAFHAALKIEAWAVRHDTERLHKQALERLGERKREAIDLALALREKTALEKRELDLLALGGKWKVWETRVSEMLSEALNFFSQFDWNASSAQFLRNLLKRQVSWREMYPAIIYQLLERYDALVSSYSESR